MLLWSSMFMGSCHNRSLWMRSGTVWEIYNWLVSINIIWRQAASAPTWQMTLQSDGLTPEQLKHSSHDLNTRDTKYLDARGVCGKIWKKNGGVCCFVVVPPLTSLTAAVYTGRLKASTVKVTSTKTIRKSSKTARTVMTVIPNLTRLIWYDRPISVCPRVVLLCVVVSNATVYQSES